MRKFPKISGLLYTTNNIHFMLKHDRCHPRPVLFLSEKLPLLPRTVPHISRPARTGRWSPTGSGSVFPEILLPSPFFHLHGCCGRRKRDNCSDHFFTHVFLFLPHTQKQDTGKPDIPFLLIFYLYEELPDYFAGIYPLAFRVSAQRTAPPAAPLTVLWESPINL